jgi:hypothetical protein
VLGSDAYYRLSGSFDDGADKNNTNFSAGQLSNAVRPTSFFRSTRPALYRHLAY